MDPWHDAVTALRDGNAAAALAACDRVLRADPRHAGALRMRGRLRYTAGLHAEALDDMAALAAVAPFDPEAHESHGVVLLALGRAHLARIALERARALAPSDAGILSNLGVALQHCGLRQEPLACFREALARGAGVGVRLRLAAALLESGAPEPAAEQYEAARTDAPFDGTVGLATVRERQGRKEEARVLLASLASASAPDPASAARYAVVASLCAEPPGSALPIVDAALSLPQANVSRQRLLHARARLLDAEGRTAEAFGAWGQAHAVAGASSDVRTHQRSVVGTVATFTRAALIRPPVRGHPTRLPVFVVGLPRSGTSLVEQVLACHPNVRAGGERPDVPDLVARLCAAHGLPWPEALLHAAPAALEAAAVELADGLAALADGAACVTDKMPSNALHLGLISWLLPNARVVVCARDPMDTLLSCYQQDFPPAQAWTRSLGGLASQALLHHRVMAHWRSVLPLPILEVRYEELVTAPERVIPALVAFCGLPWDPACLHPERSARYVSTASYDQVRRPISPASIGRWRRYAAELEPLRQMLVRGGLLSE